MKLALSTLTLGLLLLAAGQAQATGYTFTITTATDSGFGTLNTTGNVAFTGSLTVNGGGAIPAGVYPLFPNPTAPAASFSPGGFFIYDDLVFPASDPILTNPGLLFIGGGYEVNIFSNGPGDYAFLANNGGGYLGSGGGGTFTLTEVVPEPGVVAFGILSAGSVLGLIARKRKA